MRQLCSPSRQHPRPPRLHRIRTLAAATGRRACPAPVTSQAQALSTRTEVAGALGIYQATISIRVVVALNAMPSAQYPVQEHRSTRAGGHGRHAGSCHERDTLRLFETTSRSSESAIETSAMTADRSANCAFLRIRALATVARGDPHGPPDHARRMLRGACSLSMAWTDGKARGLRRRTSSSPYTHSESEGARGAPSCMQSPRALQRCRSWRAHLDHRPPIFELAVLVHLNRLKSIWRLR